MTNKKIGNTFETALCNLLFQNGFWAHNMTQNAAGQPADVIAVKEHYHTLIDCKALSQQRAFPFSRVEDNQRSAMELFRQRGFWCCWFALLLPDGEIRMLKYEDILKMEQEGKTSLPFQEIKDRTMTFKVWANMVNVTVGKT